MSSIVISVLKAARSSLPQEKTNPCAVKRPTPKTKRTPEVNWLMALPMVSLTVIVLLLPAMMQRIDPVPGIADFPLPVALAIVVSGATGVLLGSVVHLDRFWSRSRLPALRVLQAQHALRADAVDLPGDEGRVAFGSVQGHLERGRAGIEG